MVNTFLSQENQILKKQFEQFAQDKFTPVNKLDNQKNNPSIFLQQLAQAGYLGLNAPASHGGKNSPFLDIILLAETLGHYDAGMTIYLAYHVAAIELIKSYGSEEQKNNYLTKLRQGEIIGTLAYLNPADDIQNATLQIQTDALILNGQKDLVVLTSPGRANPDQTSPNQAVPNQNSTKNKQDSPLTNLILLFVADNLILLDNSLPPNVQSPSIQPSIKIDNWQLPMGLKSVSFNNIIFSSYHLKPNALIRQSAAESVLTLARNMVKTILAAAALGMSEETLKQTTENVKTGTRNGQKLSESQAILWKLADAATDTTAARLLIYRAAWSKDNEPESFSSYASMAKTYATAIARHHTGEGLQILLPFFQTLDFDLTRFYADSKILETFDTPNEVEKISLSRLIGI